MLNIHSLCIIRIIPFGNNKALISIIIPFGKNLLQLLKNIPKGKGITKVGKSIVAYESEDIGCAIRARRKKLGYTIEEVARANGCSMRFVSELERGKPGAGIGLVLRIAHSVGLDLATIERGGGQ